MRHQALVLLIILAFVVQALAITTAEVDRECPVCKTKNKFRAFMSYGSYVYMYPSKYQDVFFPFTHPITFYICKECHLSMYMGDFEKLPGEKVEEIKALLASARLDREFTDYKEVPVSERMAVAEKVYRALDKDDEFWAHFYRVLGYHLARERKDSAATEARLKSLEYLQRIASDNTRKGELKEILYSIAAMQYFTGSAAEAKTTLQRAARLTYKHPKADVEKNKDANAGLNAAIADYISKIESNSVPRDVEDTP